MFKKMHMHNEHKPKTTHNLDSTCLTLNAPITTKVVCFSRLVKCLRSLYGKQCGPRSDCSCSGSTLLASILILSLMLDNYLQQTTSADDIFRCIFLRVNLLYTGNPKGVS